MEIPYPGEMAAVATAFCWAVSVMSFDAAGRRVGSMAVNLIRLLIAFVLLAGLTTLLRGRPLPTDAPPSTWLYLSLSGFVGFFLGDLCLFRSFLLLGPRLATLLMSLAPPLAALGGIVLLDQHLRPLNWVGMAVTLSGVAWVVIERPLREPPVHRPHKVTPWGVTLGVLAATGQGLGMVLGAMGMRLEDGTKYNPIAATQIRALAGIVGFSVLFLALRWFGRVWAAFGERRAMTWITVGAFAGPVAGVSLAMLSIQIIPVGVAQTIMAILPVMIIPPVILIHKEHVSLRALIGAIIALVGVGMLFYSPAS